MAELIKMRRESDGHTVDVHPSMVGEYAKGEYVRLDGVSVVEPPRIGTDSGDQLSDKQLRQAIKAATGKRAPFRANRETLIARYNELNEG